jgi:hypothetical protein
MKKILKGGSCVRIKGGTNIFNSLEEDDCKRKGGSELCRCGGETPSDDNWG